MFPFLDTVYQIMPIKGSALPIFTGFLFASYLFHGASVSRMARSAFSGTKNVIAHQVNLIICPEMDAPIARMSLLHGSNQYGSEESSSVRSG